MKWSSNPVVPGNSSDLAVLPYFSVPYTITLDHDLSLGAFAPRFLSTLSLGNSHVLTISEWVHGDGTISFDAGATPATLRFPTYRATNNLYLWMSTGTGDGFIENANIEGIVRSQQPGKTITVRNCTNEHVLSATNGGILQLESVTNYGTVSVTDASLTWNGGSAGGLFMSNSTAEIRGVTAFYGASCDNSTLTVDGGGNMIDLRTGFILNHSTVNIGNANLAYLLLEQTNNSRLNVTGRVNVLVEIPLSDSTGPIYLNGGTISGGTFTSTGAGRILVSDGSAGALNFVTLTQSLLPLAENTTLDISSFIRLKGTTITLDGTASSPARLQCGSFAELLGSGTIEFRGTGDSSRVAVSNPSATALLTTDAGITVLARDFGGTIDATGGWYTNAGAVIAQGQRIALLGTIENTGTFTASQNGTLEFATDAVCVNISDGRLSRGTWQVDSGSWIILPAEVVSNAATIALSGNGGITGLGPLRANSGTLTIDGGHRLEISDSFTNSGTVSLMDRAELSVPQVLTNRRRLFVDATSVLSCDSLVIPTTATAANLSIDGTLVVRSSLSNGGTITLNGQALLDYASGSPVVTIRDQLRSGYHAGAWDGVGINSTLASQNAQLGIAYLDGPGLMKLVTPHSPISQRDDTSLVLLITLWGDATLDGRVDTIDFNRLAGGFGSGVSYWTGGDFNYDGIADSTDFGMFCANYGKSISLAAGLGASVPEPASGVILALTIPLLKNRARGVQAITRRMPLLQQLV